MEAEGVISALVAIINCVTANNTVAILAVGKISNEIADTYGVNKSKSASLLDTFSCVMQGLRCPMVRSFSLLPA